MATSNTDPNDNKSNEKKNTVIMTDANGNKIYIKDPTGNEIGSSGKIIAGILIVAVTLFAALALIAHWPDKLPPVGNDVCSKYQYKWFSVTYLGDSGIATDKESIRGKQSDSSRLKKDTTSLDTSHVNQQQNAQQTGDQRINNSLCKKCNSRTIDLNTLLLLLVAISGFLGSMIHVGSSFTNFIGAGSFKRSWLLWYCVKPFTAAALAVGVYIIFRAGFLNSSDATASVNLYGVVAIAILTGLFTDMATVKLKEVFAVIFQSSSVRPNPLGYPPIKITSQNPTALVLNKPTGIVLGGINFDNRKLKIKIEGEEIKSPVIQANSIAFQYTAIKDKPQLIIYDEKDVEVIKYDLITSPAETDNN
jgi:hypothetical protein